MIDAYASPLTRDSQSTVQGQQINIPAMQVAPGVTAPAMNMTAPGQTITNEADRVGGLTNPQYKAMAGSMDRNALAQALMGGLQGDARDKIGYERQLAATAEDRAFQRENWARQSEEQRLNREADNALADKRLAFTEAQADRRASAQRNHELRMMDAAGRKEEQKRLGAAWSSYSDAKKRGGDVDMLEGTVRDLDRVIGMTASTDFRGGNLQDIKTQIGSALGSLGVAGGSSLVQNATSMQEIDGILAANMGDIVKQFGPPYSDADMKIAQRAAGLAQAGNTKEAMLTLSTIRREKLWRQAQTYNNRLDAEAKAAKAVGLNNLDFSVHRANLDPWKGVDALAKKYGKKSVSKSSGMQPLSEEDQSLVYKYLRGT
jgi:hypothetical protein